MKALLAAALCAAAAFAQAQSSARETATWVVERLAHGEIEAVAGNSNAPERRLQVLREYRARVGDAEFRRVFAQYRASPIVDEIALGSHRLVIWRLGAADGHLAGQYFVEKDGRFLIDDVPSETRTRLRRVLEDYRKGKTTP